MAKKDKINVNESSSLKHNPFVGLTGIKAKLAENGEPSTAPAIPETVISTGQDNARTTPLCGRLILRRETKHRGGKTVVIVSGFGAQSDWDSRTIAELAKHLKTQLACGGSVVSHEGESEIVLQGDHPARVAELLRARGLDVGGVTS
ncbi:MAG: translation initiation factor [Deltaproteobacteria bacterium]|nr:translation initiation factor [Deltaproteobacteria bacterium]